MVDYKNSKIYKIRSYKTDDIYIGSTTQTLCKRLAKHNSNYRSYKKGNTYENYMTSFKILEFGDAYIELIEICSCNSKEELHKIEGEYIRNLDCVNKNNPSPTEKEKKEQNRKKTKKYINNMTAEQKEKLSIYNTEYLKEYYKKNRVDRLEKQKVNVECECGAILRKHHLLRHKKSIKHIKYLETV